MSVKEIGRLGDWIEKRTSRFINRSGATVNRGDILAVDLTGSDGDVMTYAAYAASTGPDQRTSPLANVIAVGAAHDDGWILVVCLDDEVADNAMGTFAVRGVVDVEVVGGSAVSSGDRLSPTSGQTYASAEAEGAATIGIALDDGPAGAAARVKCVFDGWTIAGPQSTLLP